MAYVSLPHPLPGMPGLLAGFPVTAGPLGALADALLRRDDGLTRSERELIGAYVSAGNRCTYCTRMHGAVACAHPGADAATVTAVLDAAGRPADRLPEPTASPERPEVVHLPESPEPSQVAQPPESPQPLKLALLPEPPELPERLRRLLELAEEVRRGGDQVREATLDAARAAGASDLELHDTVLIAAAFCMFNRYVDGLRTTLPDDPDWYRHGARGLVEHGYSVG